MAIASVFNVFSYFFTRAILYYKFTTMLNIHNFIYSNVVPLQGNFKRDRHFIFFVQNTTKNRSKT